jgi:hypothetical protein
VLDTDGGPLQARLKTLNVDVVVIRPVHHMMLFDHKRFYVEAGKPVEVIFENTDVMPHNLVFVKPGALTEVGLAAEELVAVAPGTRRGGFAKQHRGALKRILFNVVHDRHVCRDFRSGPALWLLIELKLEVINANGAQVRPASVVFQTPPLHMPM